MKMNLSRLRPVTRLERPQLLWFCIIKIQMHLHKPSTDRNSIDPCRGEVIWTDTFEFVFVCLFVFSLAPFNKLVAKRCRQIVDWNSDFRKLLKLIKQSDCLTWD